MQQVGLQPRRFGGPELGLADGQLHWPGFQHESPEPGHVLLAMVLAEIDKEVGGPAGLIGVKAQRPGSAGPAHPFEHLGASRLDQVPGLERDRRPCARRHRSGSASITRRGPGEGALHRRALGRGGAQVGQLMLVRRAQVVEQTPHQPEGPAVPTGGDADRSEQEARPAGVEAGRPDARPSR